MTARKHTVLMLALAGAVTLPAFAVETAEDEHARHHPQEVQTNVAEQTQVAAPSAQERRLAMRQRMQEIRATQDADKRRQLLEAQMKDIEALLDEGVCPQPGSGMMAGQGRQGMMGGMMGRGMQHGGMGGKGMQGGMACGMGGLGMQHGIVGQGQAGADDATVRRLEALEKRVDLIQMMLQMQAR
ncbi:MAG: hypothetical protein ACK4TK_01355 [Thiobacillaceae bacterium]